MRRGHICSYFSKKCWRELTRTHIVIGDIACDVRRWSDEMIKKRDEARNKNKRIHKKSKTNCRKSDEKGAKISPFFPDINRHHTSPRRPFCVCFEKFRYSGGEADRTFFFQHFPTVCLCKSIRDEANISLLQVDFTWIFVYLPLPNKLKL